MNQVTRRSGSTQATRWAAAGFLLALAASVVVLLAPLTERGEECPVSPLSPAGSQEQVGACSPRVTHPSLLAEEGWSVAIPLSVPLALAGAGLWSARRRLRPLLIVITALLGAFVFLAALSVGIYFLPAHAAMIVATAKVSA